MIYKISYVDIYTEDLQCSFFTHFVGSRRIVSDIEKSINEKLLRYVVKENKRRQEALDCSLPTLTIEKAWEETYFKVTKYPTPKGKNNWLVFIARHVQ